MDLLHHVRLEKLGLIWERGMWFVVVFFVSGGWKKLLTCIMNGLASCRASGGVGALLGIKIHGV